MALILVEAFYLHVETRIGIKNESRLLFDIVRKIHLVVALDTVEFGKNLFVVRVLFKSDKFARVSHETVAYQFFDKFGKFGV